MNHAEVYMEYLRRFNVDDSDVLVWYPYGSHCIRVRMKSGSEMVFFFHHDKDWGLLSKDAWLNYLRKEVI